MRHFLLKFHNFIPNSLRIETYSDSCKRPWCVLPYTSLSPPRYLCRHQVCIDSFLSLSFSLFLPSRMFSYHKLRTVSIIYGGYLSKSSSLGDGDAFSNYCHPRYELRHLCLSSYWSCLFLLHHSLLTRILEILPFPFMLFPLYLDTHASRARTLYLASCCITCSPNCTWHQRCSIRLTRQTNELFQLPAKPAIKLAQQPCSVELEIIRHEAWFFPV